ncbi:MAG TPA: hypothetical protein VK186_15600 [Candidatus Deferrimicrobium sp.]|nr:hypothetical protein [Candidatus Deferrimicrobium sp.]
MPTNQLITNQTKFLHEVINNILPSSQNLFFLMGYFYFSGFQELHENLRGLANNSAKAQYDHMPALVEPMLEFQRKFQEEVIQSLSDIWVLVIWICFGFRISDFVLF